MKEVSSKLQWETFESDIKAESHCSDNERERILLVELFHAEFAHAHSTNRMRSLCVVLVIVSVIAVV